MKENVQSAVWSFDLTFCEKEIPTVGSKDPTALYLKNNPHQ
jgi:hypothetical protein